MANIRAKKVILKNRDGEHLVPITDVDALNYKNITNCLLEVPQRIKYDLTDGVLTIKKGSQVVVPYGNHERDIIVAGSPTITSDGVASNFSSSNYIELKQTFTTLESGSEIVFNATLTGGADQRIICFNSYTLHFGVNASNLVKIWISSTGSSWDIANGTTGKTTLSNNVNYYFKFSFTGTAYKVDISTDGVTYNNEITINSSSQIYTLGKAMISNYPSGSGASATGYWRGSIDLSKSYIKNGSDIIWSGADKVLEKYPVGSTFLNDNYKVVDTQFANGKFFVWAELVNDCVSEQYTSTGVYTRVVSITLTTFKLCWNASHYSVTTTPSYDHGAQFYNTTTNECWNTTSDGTIANQLSLPFCIVTSNTSYAFASINQVFNGMGYIGSTYWIDKGVKGLFPNGRNKDGSLKNIEHTQNKLLIATVPSNITRDYSFVMDNENGTAVGLYPSVDEVPSTAIPGTTWLLHKSSNLTYQWDGNGYALKVRSVTGEYLPIIDIGRATFTNGVISNFQPKQPFHAVDFNELKREIDNVVPVGSVIAFGENSKTPTGYLYCNGAAVSRTTYAALFNVIGTSHGTGDGSTTFNLPNYTGCKFVTSTDVAVFGDGKSLGLNNGSVNLGLGNAGSGVGTYANKKYFHVNRGTNNYETYTTDGAMGVSTSSSTSGLKGTVSAVAFKWYIKY